MLTLPEKIRRQKMHYISLRSRLSAKLITVQSQIFFDETLREAQKQGMEALGPAFLRLHVFRSHDDLEAEFGFLTDRPLQANGPFQTGTLPAAHYVRSTWRGGYERLRDVHVIVIQWAQYAGLEIEQTRDESGLHFGCLLNIFHRNSLQEPDSEKWVTDIMCKVRQKAKG